MIARSLAELGHSLDFAGKPQEAAEVLRRSVDMWAGLMKDYPSVGEWRIQCAYSYLGLGTSLSAAGQHAEADLAYQKASELAPQDGLVQNNLAWQLATRDAKRHDPEWAVQLAKKAVELSPKEGSYWNTLGVAHYRAGEFKQAVQELEQSMQLGKGGTSEDFFFLAMAHWQLGNKEDAHKWYDHAVAWMGKNRPQNEELRRFRTEAEELLKITDKKPTTKPEPK
jgi:Flp pilus assembly protein TadD